jgi:hypothetical protein
MALQMSIREASLPRFRVKNNAGGGFANKKACPINSFPPISFGQIRFSPRRLLFLRR